MGSISDVLTPELVDQHLDSLTTEQLQELYAEHLPEALHRTNQNVTKAEIMEVVRSGFFQQTTNKLSQQLREGSGAGLLLAQSLKYDYAGEGVDGFLQGIRQLAKKESEQEQKEKEKEEEQRE